MGIRSRRKKLGYSQYDLARMLGVDQTAVHSWEQGKTLPNAKRLPAIARILNCSIDELLQEDATDNQNDDSDALTN